MSHLFLLRRLGCKGGSSAVRERGFCKALRSTKIPCKSSHPFANPQAKFLLHRLSILGTRRCGKSWFATRAWFPFPFFYVSSMEPPERRADPYHGSSEQMYRPDSLGKPPTVRPCRGSTVEELQN
ncbi:hypothetical protein ASPZODRAFT_24829, partial [Penicilliopsis zonata CBS 506.65]